jgi:hypothetical protein
VAYLELATFDPEGCCVDGFERAWNQEGTEFDPVKGPIQAALHQPMGSAKKEVYWFYTIRVPNH